MSDHNSTWSYHLAFHIRAYTHGCGKARAGLQFLFRDAPKSVETSIRFSTGFPKRPFDVYAFKLYKGVSCALTAHMGLKPKRSQNA
jgi:hypothetical protein